MSSHLELYCKLLQRICEATRLPHFVDHSRFAQKRQCNFTQTIHAIAKCVGGKVKYAIRILPVLHDRGFKPILAPLNYTHQST